MNKKNKESSFYVFYFVLLMCLTSGCILSSIAYLLQKPKNKSKELHKIKEMLISTKILNRKNQFQIEKNSKWIPAYFDRKENVLKESSDFITARNNDILSFSERFIFPLVTTKAGEVFSLEETNLSVDDICLSKTKESYFLFYVLLNKEIANKFDFKKNINDIQAIIIPVSGFGLWSSIYGFISIRNDGTTVLGTTWYQQGETPGLGANIVEEEWQNQFYNKKIFLESLNGVTDFKQTPIGITVIKGNVSSLLMDSPKALSSVDGISGATLTGNGVTDAYHNSLSSYRQLLIFFHENTKK